MKKKIVVVEDDDDDDGHFSFFYEVRAEQLVDVDVVMIIDSEFAELLLQMLYLEIDVIVWHIENIWR